MAVLPSLPGPSASLEGESVEAAEIDQYRKELQIGNGITDEELKRVELVPGPRGNINRGRPSSGSWENWP